jgi:hypothetical protein
MRSLSKVFSQIEGSSTTFTADHTSVTSSAMGIDIVSKLTPAQGNYTFAVLAVEYFMKWIEAKPLTNVSSATINKFFWQNIIFHYGDP